MTTLNRWDRVHDDPRAGDAPPLEIDRQRIVHAAAFRRLQHKTQAFVAPDSDHFRTRLTHTLEVAHLSRVIARRLGLDADLAEVVALAHDLGHPPFGHAGERALSEAMRDHGGFEHNQHTLRVVEHLEHPYPAFRGLNLTRIVRECLAKHATPFDAPAWHPLQDGVAPPPESRVCDIGDRVAYALHDLQDGLYAGLLAPETLAASTLWCQHFDRASAGEWRGRLRETIDAIQAEALDALHMAPRDDGVTVVFHPAFDARLSELERLLRTNVYGSERVRSTDANAASMVRAVFDALAADPSRLPPRFARRVADEGLHRVIADYVAGMTDRFCSDVHAEVCG